MNKHLNECHAASFEWATDKAERERAYDLLEACEDGAVAAECVGALTDVLRRKVEEVNAAEWQRAALTLGHLFSQDMLAVGTEWAKDNRYLATWTSPGNALDIAISKPPATLTRDDALLFAADHLPWSGMFSYRCQPILDVLRWICFLGCQPVLN